jgi:hypothetical protein
MTPQPGSSSGRCGELPDMGNYSTTSFTILLFLHQKHSVFFITGIQSDSQVEKANASVVTPSMPRQHVLMPLEANHDPRNADGQLSPIETAQQASFPEEPTTSSKAHKRQGSCCPQQRLEKVAASACSSGL